MKRLLKNMTPHPVTIYRLDCDEPLATIPPSGEVFRLKEIAGDRAGSLWIDHRTVQMGHFEPDGNYCLAVPCLTRTLEASEDSLPPEDGVVYIVSLPALPSFSGREDVCCPDTGPGAVRDATGQIIGTRHLIFNQLPAGPVDGASKLFRWLGSTEEMNAALNAQEEERS